MFYCGFRVLAVSLGGAIISGRAVGQAISLQTGWAYR